MDFFRSIFRSAIAKVNPAIFIPNAIVKVNARIGVSLFPKPNDCQNVATRKVSPIIIELMSKDLFAFSFILMLLNMLSII